MKQNTRAYIYALTAILFWSTVASAFKLALSHIHYLYLLLYATLVSTMILWIYLVVSGGNKQLRNMTLKDLVFSAFLGFLNPFLYYLILLNAYTILRAQEAGTLNYIWPVLLVLLSIPLLKQKVGLLSMGALLISFSGIIVIATEGHLSTLRFREPLGVALALCSGLIWALYWIFNTKDRQDPVLRLFLNFVFGSVYLLITVSLVKGFRLPDLPGLAGAVYIGFFEMGFGFILWLKAMKYCTRTVQISNLVYLSPFISLVIIRTALGEKILTATVAGLVLIVAGIILQQRVGSRRTKRTKSKTDP